jgi:multidrug resistance efflux pump
MQTELPESSSAAAQASARLAALVDFAGPAEAFWPQYLQCVGLSLSARRVLLLSSAVGRPWQARAQWPSRGAETAEDPDWTLELLSHSQAGLPHARRNARDQLALTMTPSALIENAGQVLAVVVLDINTGQWDENRLCAWAALAAPIPVQFMRRSSAPAAGRAATDQQATPIHHVTSGPTNAEASVASDDTGSDESAGSLVQRAERLYDVLRLGIRLQQESRFMSLAMALCNELALRFACERVSLGWVARHYVKLTAVSHIEHFDAKAQATRALEAVMEEALDQESLLSFPAQPEGDHVLRAHQAYCETVGATQLTTLPLLHGDRVDAVLCLERQAGVLTQAEQWELRLIGESLARWLSTLHDQDRWFGARWWHACREQAAVVLRPRHTALKLSVALGTIMLLVLVLTPWNYRVDAALAIRSQDLLFMPAPFDGYLRKVQVQVGDQVAAGATMVELDTRDLALEASMAEADLVRYGRESEKALAAGQLAEMQISAARAQQAAARLEMIRYQLDHAQVRAPYAGVVIEGDLQKNLGAPVRKGDLLLKLAQTSNAYIELEIDQAYIHDVKVGSRGEFALVGRPEERFGITVTRIDPAALTRDGRTFYLARAGLDGAFRPNWRPGMGGNAKIEAGDRSLIWIMTHRTVRFLREYFWI